MSDPIASKLQALTEAQERKRAQSAPQVRAGYGRRYFITECPHCGSNGYHHLDALEHPANGPCTLELAHCEDCGVVERWRLLALKDGSVRVLGPDFGPAGPPVPPR